MASIMRRASEGILSPLAKELVVVIRAIQKHNGYAKVKGRVNIPEIEAIIKKHTKAERFEVVVDGGLRRNAWAVSPRISKNNPMMYDWWRQLWPEELEDHGYAQLSQNKHPLGWIDDDGSFNGFFRKLPYEIGLSWDMLTPTGDIKHTPEEVAATFLHELGHICYYLKMLDVTARANQVLAAAHNSMMDTGDTKRRVVLLRQIENMEGWEIPDLEYVARENKKELTTTVLLGASIRKFRNEVGDDIYNLRGFESLADHFATEHGLGLALSTGLDKLHIGSASKFKNASLTFYQAMESIFLIFASIQTVGLIPILLMLGVLNPSEKIYDDPKDRHARTRRQLIQHLKESKTEEAQDKLLAQIDQIEAIMAEYHNKRGVAEALFETLSPVGRKIHSARKLNQELEILTNNELFVAAARLRQYA